jgi:hypothetical protein
MRRRLADLIDGAGLVLIVSGLVVICLGIIAFRSINSRFAEAGNDYRPTFNSAHCPEALEKVGVVMGFDMANKSVGILLCARADSEVMSILVQPDGTP